MRRSTGRMLQLLPVSFRLIGPVHHLYVAHYEGLMLAFACFYKQTHPHRPLYY
jgi:hypothetical protein